MSLEHDRDKEYIVPLNLYRTVSSFNEKWTLNEEVLLMESLLLFGFWNWDEISKYLQTKSAEECKEYYLSRFIYCVPDDNTNGLTKLGDPGSNLILTEDEQLSIDLIDEELKRDVSKFKSLEKKVNIEGFLPGRSEFKDEYDNDHEQELFDITLSNKDLFNNSSSENRRLVVNRVKNYQQVLLKRKRYKKTALDFIIPMLSNRKKVKYSPESLESGVVSFLKPFSRYLSYDEYTKIEAGFLNEVSLLNRVANMKPVNNENEIDHFVQMDPSLTCSEDETKIQELNSHLGLINPRQGIGYIKHEITKKLFNDKILKSSTRTDKFFPANRDCLPTRIIIDGKRCDNEVKLYCRLLFS